MSARLADLSPAALVRCDRSDVVRDMNDAAEALFSQSRGRLIGKPLAQVLDAESELFPLIQRACETDAPVTARGVAIGGPIMGFAEIDVRLSPLADGYVFAALEATGRSGEGASDGMADFARILWTRSQKPARRNFRGRATSAT